MGARVRVVVIGRAGQELPVAGVELVGRSRVDLASTSSSAAAQLSQ